MEIWIVYSPGNLLPPAAFSTHAKARAYRELLERDGIPALIEKVTVNAATPGTGNIFDL